MSTHSPSPATDHAATIRPGLSDQLGNSTTVKLFLLCLLCLFLLIPLGMVQSMVSERRALKDQAEQSVAQGLAYRPRVVTPYLVVTSETAPEPKKKPQRHDWVIVPTSGKADVALDVSMRKLGIYQVPTLAAKLRINAVWDAATLEQAERQMLGVVDWRSARIEFALSEPRGLRSPGVIELGVSEPGDTSTRSSSHSPLPIEPIGQAFGSFYGVGARLGWDARRMQTISASIAIEHVGTHAIELLTLARNHQTSMRGNWPHPSYLGGALPAQHSNDAEGFEAHWTLSEFNLGLPRLLAHNEELQLPPVTLRLFQPADIYQQSERSVKYGALIIGLATLSFFLAEVLLRVRLHPVHYGLIGMTLAVFYLLLLALSELLGFAPAFVIAALASCLLLGGYATAILRGSRRGAAAASGLAVVYVYSFVLVTSESLNLLMGAVGLVLLLALTMYFTRRIDWYARLPAG